jgi:hypothetical protein
MFTTVLQEKPVEKSELIILHNVQELVRSVLFQLCHLSSNNVKKINLLDTNKSYFPFPFYIFPIIARRI